jgi:hypothetical protein
MIEAQLCKYFSTREEVLSAEQQNQLDFFYGSKIIRSLMKTGSIVLSGIMMYALDSSAYTAIIGYEMPALVYELLDCYSTNCKSSRIFSESCG